MEKYYKKIPSPKVLNVQKDHDILMKAVVDSLCLFLCQGWAYEGIEPVEDIWGNKLDTADELGMISSDRRMFVDLLDLLAKVNNAVSNALMKDVSESNRKFTSQEVQRDIVKICAKETIKSIFSEIGDSNYSLILDSWSGITWHRNVSLIVRFVNKVGAVIERFLGIITVPDEDRTAASLKKAIEEYLKEVGIKLEKLRCHSYNGSSDLCLLLSDLSGVLLEEHKLADYIHCSSHQFILTVIASGKYNCAIYNLFKSLDRLREFFKDMPIKLMDLAKEEELAKITRSVHVISAVFTGDKLLYHDAIVGLIADYSKVLDLLEFTSDCGSCQDQKWKSYQLLESVFTFEFALSLHLMRDIVGFTSEMSQLLEMRENEIEKAVSLVGMVNQKLGDLTDHGWDPLFSEVCVFCEKNEMTIPDMTATYLERASIRRKGRKITYLQYYHDELFLPVVELVIKEINKQFTESNTKLILCIAAMNPGNSFSSFDKDKIVCFAQFFPCDFSQEEIGMLENQLEKYIVDMKSSTDFKDLDGLAKLAEKLVETQRIEVYPQVYRVIELALTFPIAAPAIERVVSSGKVVQKWVTERVGNEWVNDCLVTYIEQDIFRGVENEMIIKRFDSSNGSLKQD